MTDLVLDSEEFYSFSMMGFISLNKIITIRDLKVKEHQNIEVMHH